MMKRKSEKSTTTLCKKFRFRISLGMKTAFGILCIAIALSCTAIIFSYHTYKAALQEQLITTAYNLAYTAASIVDPASIDTYLETGKADTAYTETRNRLIQLQKNNDIEYIVITKPTENGFYYVYDTDQTGEAFQLGDFQKYYSGDFLDNKANFLAGKEITPLISNKEFGWLLSALVPIKDSNGVTHGYVDLDLSMNKIIEMEHQFLFRICYILICLTIALVIIIVLVIRKLLVRPINCLAFAAANFTHSEEHDKNRHIVQVPELDVPDELGDLYRSIQQMEQDIYQYIDNLMSVTAEKERIGAELDVAKHIQASMLPCLFPAFPEHSEFDIYATMTPAKEVGGDFYDFFLIDEDHLAMVMADVSGKGVPAALFMVISKTLIKTTAQTTGLTPAKILEKVNNLLCETNEEEMFVTVLLGILELSTGKLRAANAGHEYPAICRSNGSFELYQDQHGFVVAGMPDMKYQDYEEELHAGDRLFLYTDGVPEATNAQNELYGTDRMLLALNRIHDDPASKNEDNHIEPSTYLRGLKADIDQFVGSAPQFDDITMLLIDLYKKAAPMENIYPFVPVMENLQETEDFLNNQLEKYGVPMREINQVSIAADEILSNIIRYSTAQNAKLIIHISHDDITIRFCDDGIAYDPTAHEDPQTSLSAADRKIGGLGIFMVRKMMDEFTYERIDDWNNLTITKKIS